MSDWLYPIGFSLVLFYFWCMDLSKIAKNHEARIKELEGKP